MSLPTPMRLLVMLIGAAICTGLATVGEPASPASARGVTAQSLLHGILVRAESRVPWKDDAFPYPADLDGDCRGTRAEVLATWSRKSVAAGCTVTTGSWRSLYDDKLSERATGLEVSHVVSALEAWRSGAQGWSAEDRRAFANDLGYRWSLIPVSRGFASERRSRGPATWLPPKNRCTYAKAWIGVKWRWRLTVDPAEKKALQRVLSTCTSSSMATPPSRRRATSMPIGDLPHWKQFIAQDFARSAPLGTFAQRYPNWAGYDSGRDSSWDHGRPAAQQGVYRSATTSSVHDGVFDCYVHTAGVQPQVCAVTPTPNDEWYRGQKYGRYSVRFRTDEVPGYKIAWLLWPSTNEWADGEIDFPEADLGGEIWAAAHDVNGNPSRNAFIVGTGTTTTAWHTATIEWTPGRIRYLLDDKQWTTTTRSAMPEGAMRWALQAETLLKAAPPARSAAGHIVIDWLTAYRYVP